MLPRRNVLIFQAGALGDFVLTWPLALALGRLYPQSRVFYVTHGSKATLAEKVLRVEGADLESGWSALHSTDAPLAPLVEKRLTSAHSVFTFLSNGHDQWADRTRQIAGDIELFPLSMPTMNHTGPIHATEMLVDQLKPWPAVQTALQQILRSVADRGVGYRLSPDGAVVIHPGSGSPQKNWPIERYIQLGQQLCEAGRRVKFIVGEVELERWPAEQLQTFETVGPVIRSMDYLALLQSLETASLFIGNDSGPGHLAAIIGVPVISLFGPTDPVVWKPLGPRVRVLQAKPFEGLSVDEVMGAIGK